MLKRQDLPASEQPTAIINQLVVDCPEHIHVNIREFNFLQFGQALVGFVKVDAFPARNLIMLGAPRLLRLFVAKVVRLADFGKVIHILGTQLQFRVATRQVVIKRYMQRLVARISRLGH